MSSKSSKEMIDDSFVVSKESWEKDGDADEYMDSQNDHDAVTAVWRWSERLTSPTGMGLQLTCSRATRLTRCNRRAVSLLLETSHLFDTYAQDLLKSSNTLNSIMEEGVPSIRQLVLTSSGAYSRLAKAIKAISLPLERFLGTHDEATNSLYERYNICSRRTAEKARQKALSARSVYVAIHKTVSTSLEEWKKEQGYTSSDGDGDDAAKQKQLPEKIASKLAQLKACEARYKRLVLWENECVRQCQRLQVMALESMQQLEENRFVIFVYSLTKLLTAAGKDTASNKAATEAGADAPLEKKSEKRSVRNHSLSGIIMTVDEEEGAGVMDAETLGLPIEIGQLRDQVRLLAATRAKTVQTARVLAAFLDNAAVATTKLGNGLKQQHINGSESVRDAMSTTGEGSRAIKLWNALSKTLGQEGSDALVLVEQIKALRSETFDHILEYGDKILKPSAERDNATWKQLCDAARSQAKAELRYQEATTQTARARDRCKSVDSDGTVGSSLGITASKQMSQSLANMFSILPNGGERAMKVLDPSTRASVAHLSLEEAIQKETKERQLLDSAIELTALSLEAYKSIADTVLRHCEEKQPENYCMLLDSLGTHLAAFHAARQHSLRSVHHMTSLRAWVGVSSYLNKWSSTTQQSLNVGHAEINPDLLASTEPMLSVQLEQSEIVQRALRSLEGHPDGLPEASEGAQDETESEACGDEGPLFSTPLRERAASASSVNAHKSPVDEPPSSWLLRSLTMPDTDSIFGKLTMTKKVPRSRQTEFDDVDTETSIFTGYFWPEDLDSKCIPHIVDSFACSFRDGAQRFPFQYGRAFITNDRLIFVGWTRKQLCLQWEAVVGVEPVKNSMSAQDDSFVVKCRKNASAEESYMVLSGFYDRQQAFELIEKVREQARARSAVPTTTSAVDVFTPPTTPERSLGVIPADGTLGKMVGVVSGRLGSLSIQNFYNIIWSEGNVSNEEAFYRSWLEKECFDIEMGQWDVHDVIGPWCGEHYTQKRELRYKVQRKTHLYIGPPIANVSQTQYCRVEGNDRCIVQMRVGFEGIPYADTFAVEIRWVATREGERDIKVEVGVEVDFKKSTFLKSKIRSGTIEETASVHRDLFKAVQAACAATSGVEPEEVEVESSVRRVGSSEFEVVSTKDISLLDNRTWERYVVAACGVLVLLATLWRLFVRGTRSDNVIGAAAATSMISADDVAALGAQIERLEAEMTMVRVTLAEILSLVRSKYESN